MFVGWARYDLRLPGCTSLKDKRSVVRTLTGSIHQRFRCAVGEVDHQDLRQRAAIGFSIVAPSTFQARKVLQQIGRHVETHPGVEVIDAATDVIGSEDDR